MRTKFIFLLYRVLLAGLFPVVILYFLFRAWRDPRYLKTLPERCGFLPRTYQRTTAGSVWLHAVSVGEVLSSVELVRRLQGYEIFVSCATLAGRQVAEEKLAGLTAGIFYAPLDYVWMVRRVLRSIRPSVLVVLETEIWPNTWHEAKRSGAGVVVVNGRISPAAFPAYRRWRAFFRAILAIPDRIFTQGRGDLERYRDLGAPADRTEFGGNLKFDFNPRTVHMPEEVRQLLDASGCREIWIAASTMPPANPSDVDEDDAVIASWRQVSTDHPDTMLILVPRKPERFDVVAEKLQRAGIEFVRRSQLPAPPANVLLLDSMGELSSLFGAASVVFMGGSLADRGGHNILEPAFFGCPIVLGPHMENFAEITAAFLETDAVLRIASAESLATAVSGLLTDAGTMGERAKRAAEAQRGAVARAVALIEDALDAAVPQRLPYGLLTPLLWMLSLLWIAGGRLKRLGTIRQLDQPVISVGGLAMGGVGKTPFVSFLADRLSIQGLRPAILTRGYGRKGSAVITLEPGATALARTTGDEPQIYLHQGLAALGIAADRYAAARRLQQEYKPDVFLLDDGFQHARLHRDLDIVLIDALDPFAGGAPFPLGQLREGFQALRRAHMFVITRATEGRRYRGIRQTLDRWNPGAPVFLSRVMPVAWVNTQTGEHRAPSAFAGLAAGAFCGLANPNAFWNTLGEIGLHPQFQQSFQDHYKYGIDDVVTLKERAPLLLTTEKDAVNLPAPSAEIWYLRISVEVEREEELLRTVSAVSARP